MNFTQYRPNFPPGKGNALLPRLVRDLKKHLLKTQRQLASDTLRLGAACLCQQKQHHRLIKNSATCLVKK